MRKQAIQEKKFSEMTGKLHLPCPYRNKTGIKIHVVIKDGICYKAGQCLVVECKHNNIQDDLERLISITW
jgi:hypothetical protein